MLLTFYLSKKKNTTVQSYKDTYFEKRTEGCGECCVHIGNNPICPVDRGKKGLGQTRGEKTPHFKSNVREITI